MHQHTLRVEIKLITADQFKPLGIKTLANINAVTLQNAKNLLLKRFEEVFYYDITTRTENLRSTERNALIKYKHPLYWVDELSKQKRYLHGIKLQNFIFRNSDKMKSQIIELIERKRGYQLQMTKRKGLPITSSSIGVIGNKKTHNLKESQSLFFVSFKIHKQRGGV